MQHANVRLILLCIVAMQDWDDYGVDWDGPIPHVSDDDTVVVEEIEDILSAEQKAELDDQLSSINPTLSLTESLLVNMPQLKHLFTLASPHNYLGSV